MAWVTADFNTTRWNVRVLQATYVAQYGDDRNDGAPQRPVRTIQRALVLATAKPSDTITVPSNTAIAGQVYPIVVGSGIYTEVLTHTILPYIQGDGLVVLDGKGASNLFNRGMLRNVTVQNYSSVSFVRDSALVLDRCTIKNVQHMNPIGSQVQFWDFNETLFVNAPITHLDPNTGQCTFNRCTLIKSKFSIALGTRIFRNSYLDPLSELNLPNSGVTITNSNIEGKINSNFLTALSATTPTTLTTPVAVTNCIKAPPQFNNPDVDEYTIQLSSPMRNIATDGLHVGAFRVGINFGGQADVATLVNMAWDATLQAFVLIDPLLPGSMESVVKDSSRNWVLSSPILAGMEDNIEGQTIDSILSYENAGGASVDTPSGSIVTGSIYWVSGYTQIDYNGQAYTTNQFFVGAAGVTTYVTYGLGKVVKLTETPNLRTFQMRYSLLSAADVASQPWRQFQFGLVPTVDAVSSPGNQIANGEVGYVAPGVAVAARYLQIRLTLLPNSIA